MQTFRNVLSQYLIRCNHLEIIAESIRQSLAKNIYFQSQTIFQRMDRFRNGYLIPSDFSQFLLSNQIYPREQQLYIVFRDFDPERQGVVTLSRFAEQLLPQENQKLKKQGDSKKYYQANYKLEIDLEFQLAKYLQHKIKAHKELEIIRGRLAQFYQIFSQEAFVLIDKNKKMELNVDNIDYFLRTSGKLPKQAQLLRIFKVLNQQKSFNPDQILTFDKFNQSVDPFSRGFYLNYAKQLDEKLIKQAVFLQKKRGVEIKKLNNSRRQIQAKVQLQALSNSRRHLENILYEQQRALIRNRVYQQDINRRFY